MWQTVLAGNSYKLPFNVGTQNLFVVVENYLRTLEFCKKLSIYLVFWFQEEWPPEAKVAAATSHIIQM